METQTKPSTTTAKRIANGGKVIAHRNGGVIASTDFRHSNQGHLRPAHGTGQCVCGQCGHGFYSLFGFDKHQTLDSDGSVICWDPASLGMVRNKTGWWVTSLREDYT